MAKSQEMTDKEAWDIMYPKPCKKDGPCFEFQCLKKVYKKKVFLRNIAIKYSTCGCEEGSHCSSSIEHGEAKQWGDCVESSNRSVCTRFPNGIRHHYLLNYGYLQSSCCSCRIIFPCTKVNSCGKMVGKVQNPFLQTCDEKIFLCP